MSTSLSRYVTISEAVQMLGVKPQTVYAYVSRGLVNVVRSGDGKKRLYRLTDLERLKVRAQARAGHGPAAADAMHHGAPIITTAITELTPFGPRYRGVLAADASAEYSFEQVAELLWTSRALDEGAVVWPALESIPDVVHDVGRYVFDSEGPDAILHVFSIYALVCGLAKRENAELQVARGIIQTLAGCFGYLSKDRCFRTPRAGESIAAAIHACLTSDNRYSADVINTVLILLADNELASATFVARVASSFNADLSACIVSAVESSTGWLKEYRRVVEFLSGVSSRAELTARVATFRDQTLVPPGFSMDYTSADDPRALLFLELSLRGTDRVVSDALREFLIDDAPALGLYARPALALAALDRAMELPEAAIPALFVIGRCAGWIAHILEQSASGLSIRPRATFQEID